MESRTQDFLLRVLSTVVTPSFCGASPASSYGLFSLAQVIIGSPLCPAIWAV